MKLPSIHSINALLQSSPIINNIRNKLQQLQELNGVVSKLLPIEAAKHCSVANLRDGILILTTSSPVWNHQINFLKMDLLENLRKNYPEWAGICSVLVKTDYLIEELNDLSHDKKINDSCLTNDVDQFKHFVISHQTAELINAMANQEISFKPLSESLKRLVRKRSI